jgi:hypothetical protein
MKFVRRTSVVRRIGHETGAIECAKIDSIHNCQ